MGEDFTTLKDFITPKEVRKAVWISYDLGIEGDYMGMYKYLDSNSAIECGDSLAFFYKNIPNNKNILEFMKNDIKTKVKLKKDDRIYLINLDPSSKKVLGNFIFGGRKRSPWEGFASAPENGESIDIIE